MFAQAVMSAAGPAAACIVLARTRTVRLVWSDYVTAEIRELPCLGMVLSSLGDRGL